LHEKQNNHGGEIMEKRELQTTIKQAWNNSNVINDTHRDYDVTELHNAGYPLSFLNEIRDGDIVSNYSLLGAIISLFGIEVRQYIGHGTSSAEYYWRVNETLTE